MRLSIRRFGVIVFVCFAALAGATTTVSGNLKKIDTSASYGGTTVTFALRNCGAGNRPVIVATGTVAELAYKPAVASDGSFTFSAYATDEISCAGQFTTYYHVSISSNGTTTSYGDAQIYTGSAFDLNTAPTCGGTTPANTSCWLTTTPAGPVVQGTVGPGGPAGPGGGNGLINVVTDSSCLVPFDNATDASTALTSCQAAYPGRTLLIPGMAANQCVYVGADFVFSALVRAEAGGCIRIGTYAASNISNINISNDGGFGIVLTVNTSSNIAGVTTNFPPAARFDQKVLISGTTTYDGMYEHYPQVAIPTTKLWLYDARGSGPTLTTGTVAVCHQVDFDGGFDAPPTAHIFTGCPSVRMLKTPIVYPQWFGAKADAEVLNGSMSASSQNWASSNSSPRVFTAADVGKTFIAQDVGPSITSPVSGPTITCVAGGNDSGSTWYAKYFYVNQQGMTAASNETSQACAANQVPKITSPSSATGATGYGVCVGKTSGSEAIENLSDISIGTDWTWPTIASNGTHGALTLTPSLFANCPSSNSTAVSLDTTVASVSSSTATLTGTATNNSQSDTLAVMCSDDTDAVQAAVYAVSRTRFYTNTGGTVGLLGGYCFGKKPLYLSIVANGVTFKGFGGASGFYPTLVFNSYLVWTGAGADPAYDFRSTSDLRIDDASLLYVSTNYTGHMISSNHCGQTGGACQDASAIHVHDAYLGGLRNTASAVSAWDASLTLESELTGTRVMGSRFGLAGGGYGELTCDTCFLANNRYADITNTGQIWRFKNSTFENLGWRSNLGTRHLYVCTAGCNSRQIIFDGNTDQDCGGYTSIRRFVMGGEDLQITKNAMLGSGCDATHSFANIIIRPDTIYGEQYSHIDISDNYFGTKIIDFRKVATLGNGIIKNNRSFFFGGGDAPTNLIANADYAVNIDVWGNSGTDGNYRKDASENKLYYPGSIYPFANLPTDASNGTLVFCSDCKNVTDDSVAFDSVAAGSGHGANVLRQNGAWRVH